MYFSVVVHIVYICRSTVLGLVLWFFIFLYFVYCFCLDGE